MKEGNYKIEIKIQNRKKKNKENQWKQKSIL